ncbi:MAG: pyridoxamine 5'-phosphate oxidase [Saprospiraceae bacterium]|jgi:pyridoxamine 5'-phosphate oxidase|nr:pyridoxamine 5'-phosphate oxidase [Saprospiraceae bacterium]MBL0025542.1 pyridoxamine 5'-phosphate oxidase [Saprospiraceae bacterium]
MNKLSDLRQDYKKNQLSEDMVSSDPLVQFDQWFSEAMEAGVTEPNAFTLATVDVSGDPSARVLLLKGVDDGGFVFYTNYESDKANHLEHRARASMCFLWLELERQVRVSGGVTKISREESEVYFHSRPRESQIGAWVSHQSHVISSRAKLEIRLEEMIEKYKNQDTIPLPDNWGGYRLIPERIEFWQGRANRLHDRLLYSKAKGLTSWIIERLAP